MKFGAGVERHLGAGAQQVDADQHPRRLVVEHEVDRALHLVVTLGLVEQEAAILGGLEPVADRDGPAAVAVGVDAFGEPVGAGRHQGAEPVAYRRPGPIEKLDEGIVEAGGAEAVGEFLQPGELLRQPGVDFDVVGGSGHVHPQHAMTRECATSAGTQSTQRHAVRSSVTIDLQRRGELSAALRHRPRERDQ